MAALFIFRRAGGVVIWRHEYGKRASIVQEELMSLYGAPPIPLVHRDAYTLLVAVLLSAQCTDKRVNLVTPALFALASTPEEMARQDVEAVREIVRPCGLSERKASSIVNLSRILVENMRERFLATLLLWSLFRGWGIKRLPSSWFRPLAFLPFRWIPIFSAFHGCGG